MTVHNCDNEICILLNPCIDELLHHDDVVRRISEVEGSSYTYINKIKMMSKTFGGTKRSDLKIRGPFDFFDWAHHHMIYQIPNIEFIQELSKEIININPKTILEVGAGRGIICRHISNILDKKIILTDSYDWIKIEDYTRNMRHSDVLKRTYIEAIEEFEPDLIIASWIPYNHCWTKDFRRYPFVQGYILIGEGRGCATGSEEDWKTDWKIRSFENVEKYGVCKTDHGFRMKNKMLGIFHTNVTYFERP